MVDALCAAVFALYHVETVQGSLFEPDTHARTLVCNMQQLLQNLTNMLAVE